MANILLIIAPSDFRDEELFHTKEELEKAGHKCIVASETTNEAKGMLGGKITPDIALADITNKEKIPYQAIVIIGGKGSLVLINNPHVMELLTKAKEENLVIGAICWGSRTAAKAGVLKNKKATGYPDEETTKIIKDAGAEYVDQGVVTDKNLVTSQGPKFARDFGKAIAALLTS